MKNKFLWIIALVAIMAYTFVACDNNNNNGEQPKLRMDNQPIQDLSWGGKVTVKSADLYLDADWAVDVAAVVAALNVAYAGDKITFDSVFKTENNTEIILIKNFGHNWETKTGEANKLYLKTDSISSVDYVFAVAFMDGTAWVGKATQLKGILIIKIV